MKPPSKKLWFALIAAVLIVIAISIATGKDLKQTQQLSDSNVVFVNHSHIPVGSIGYACPRWDGTSESGGACRADGKPMTMGQRLYLDVGFPCTLTLYSDVEGRHPLASLVVEQAPPAGEGTPVWYVIASEGPGGIFLTLSLNRDEEGLEAMKDTVSENLGVDVSAGGVSYCWHPGWGWQGDGESFTVLRFSQAEAVSLQESLSSAEGWQAGEFPEALKTGTFESVYSHESLIRWDSLPASGWFFYRDEQGERHPAQQEESFRSWDYVAAVYDPESRTLYCFEWHQ